MLDHPLVPRLIGRWEDQRISPYPFFAVTRQAGRASAGLTAQALPHFAAQLGAASPRATRPTSTSSRAACGLTRGPRRRRRRRPPRLASHRCASSAAPSALPRRAAAFCGIERSARLLDALGAAEALAPGLAHGDLHTGHILIGESGLTGILDWGFGGCCHRWSTSSATGSRRHSPPKAAYGDLRRQMWAAYAGARTVPLPPGKGSNSALAAFDITALAPETRSHYYWHASPEWKVARRAMAGGRLKAMLA